MELTNDDFNVIMEAIEKWEQNDVAGEMMADMVISIVSRDDEAMKAKFESDKMKAKVKRDDAQRIRKERGVILRAKLLAMRDYRDVDSITREGTR